MACYALGLGLRIKERSLGSRASDGRSASVDGLAASLWGLGCLFYIVHVACAFHYFHHWSHAAALEHTAVRSAEVVGRRFGEGLYLNYLFTVVWVGDAAWQLCDREGYRRRPRRYDFAVQGFMAFMALNAVVVFGHGATRWVGTAATVALVMLWIRSKRDSALRK